MVIALACPTVGGCKSCGWQVMNPGRGNAPTTESRQALSAVMSTVLLLFRIDKVLE